MMTVAIETATTRREAPQRDSRFIVTTGRRKEAGPPQTSAFAQLSRTVKAEGLLTRRRGFYLTLLGGLTVVLAAAVAAIVVLGDSWLQLVVAAALGIIFTQFAFLAHEAAHRQIFTSGKANDRLGLIIGDLVIGLSYGWWMTKHSRHHANPNTVGKDPDIEKDTISFLEEDAVESRGLVRAITKHQGYFFFPLLLLEGFNLHKHGAVAVFGRAPFKKRGLEITLMLTHFALYLGLVFTFMPPLIACAFVVVQMAVFGLYMGSTFAPNHKGMPLIAAGSNVDFLSRQILTSRNVSGSRAIDALMGGLNLQVEHHLFPSMPRPALRRAREIVRAHCAENGIAYTEATLFESYGIVIRYLNRVGLAASDPFDCPLVSAYRRRD
jgi:fatty acid desaturase